MRIYKDVTSAADGSATAYTDHIHGRLLSAIRYVPDGTSPYATGVDVTMTIEDTGESVWTESDLGTSALTRAPRQPTHKLAGSAILYVASTGEPVSDKIVVEGRIKIVLAQAGDTKTGRFYFTFE